MKTCTKLFFICFLVSATILLFQRNSNALIYPYSETYSGLQENPPNASPGTATINGTYDDVTKIVTVNVAFSGLLGNTTAAHFHSPAPPGVNAPVTVPFVGFPTGVTSGTYNNTFTLTAVTEAAFLSNLMYANIHSVVFPGGELRAQIVPDAPLPVELASFVSVISANNVTLKWTTVSETNNSGFGIERSSGNNQWTQVGFIAGNGSTSSQHNYIYTDRGLNTGNYSYRLKQIDYNGNFEYFNLSNEVNIGTPSAYKLSQNYPNPFNPSTRIDYDLPFDGKVNITLYDISGKEIAMLVNETKTAGYYSVSFNASNLSSGMYFYSIHSGDFTVTKKMTLLK